MKSILDAMNWRYSPDEFDKNKKLSDKELDTLLQAVILSPSSYGLQPWKFIVVKNTELREKIKAIGYGQNKITDASDLVVFAVEKNIDSKLVDKYMASISKIRNVSLESLKGFSSMINGVISNMTPSQRIEWATRQLYIALGVMITSGAVNGIDIGPMEGFDTVKCDEILGLSKMGLESKVMAGIGFRSATDARGKDKKVRYSKDEVVIVMK